MECHAARHAGGKEMRNDVPIGHFIDMAHERDLGRKAENDNSVAPFTGRLDIPTPNDAVAVLEDPTTIRNLRILIADDHPTILQMVRQILTAQAGFEVVGEARDGQHALTLAEALKPDVIVINVTMPKMSGFDAARLIRSRVPDSAIVILSSHKDQQFIAEARKVGANGYVEKSNADKQLIHAIESAVRGEEFFFVE
jgi:CheY-like chemotaxis protein